MRQQLQATGEYSTRQLLFRTGDTRQP